ncbi:MAG: FN3 associated domain-containing protein [Flavitalea sp.]
MIRLRNFLLSGTLLLNVMLLFLWIFDSKITGLPDWLKVAGRLHPMILHFPIVMLLLVALLEFLNKSEERESIIKLLLSITAFSASVAALCGFFLLYGGGYESSSDLYWHKVAGIITALLAGVLSSLRSFRVFVYKPVLLAGCILLIITGHLGSTITHGKNFITEPIARRSKKLKSLEEAVVYPDMIQSIFNEKCIGCHNPNKRKGELLLTSYAELVKGGESGAVFFAGNPDSSVLYKLLLLPADDERHMPPEGKPQADPEEIALIRWWIHTGAKKDQKYAGAAVPDSIATIVKAKFDAGSPLDQLKIAFADQTTIQSLTTTDRGVRQLSIEKPYINVFMANRKSIGAKELEELEPLKNQITSLDLSYSKLTNEQFKQIARFPHLTKLFLENSNFNDTVLSTLSALQYLEYLNVSNTKVSDAIFATSDKIRSLKKLFVYGNNITTASIDAYRKRVPAMVVGFTPDLSTDTLYRGRLTGPVITIDSNVFLHNATVEMTYRIRGVDLRYTLDGSDPDSASLLYKEPFEISENKLLKVRAMRSGWESSNIQAFSFVKADHSFATVSLDSMADKRYQGRLDTTLIDLRRGSLEQGDGNYLGFEGNDLGASLTLAIPTTLSRISVSYLVRHSSYLMAPASFEAWVTDENGKIIRPLGKLVITENKLKENASKEEAVLKFPAQSMQYIKIRVTNRGKLPAWHPAKGAKSWLFVDEIVI